jgi:hypothetical protein
MEFFPILLSGILRLVALDGLIADHTVIAAILSRLLRVEHLQVLVDNVPSYKLLQGKVDRVLIAGRGLHLRQYLRIYAFELETAPIYLALRSLKYAQPKLKRSYQAGVRLVLKQPDANQPLHLPELTARWRNYRVTAQLAKVIAANFVRWLVGKLERSEITSRIIQLKVTPQLEIATFLRVEPSSRILENRRSSLQLLLTILAHRYYTSPKEGF